MPSNSVDDALKRNSPEKQQENQETINSARRNIDGKTMKEVDEVAAPKPQLGRPDPYGAANTRLSPDFREKIERIQQGGPNHYGLETSTGITNLPARGVAGAEMTEGGGAALESHSLQSSPEAPELEN